MMERLNSVSIIFTSLCLAERHAHDVYRRNVELLNSLSGYAKMCLYSVQLESCDIRENSGVAPSKGGRHSTFIVSYSFYIFFSSSSALSVCMLSVHCVAHVCVCLRYSV